MCQPKTPALFGAQALLETGLLLRVPLEPSDFTGTTEGSGTIQLALSGVLHRAQSSSKAVRASQQETPHVSKPCYLL